jgi:Fe-S-cluster-containing dehydrogenase component
MTQYAIAFDLNRCVGCMACNAACKTANDVPIGKFWNRIVRIGPNPAYEGAQWPDIEWYYLPMQCQHCVDAPCVSVCPTGASTKLDDGTVQIDSDVCIGCQACVPACPYGVRYLNEDLNVVQKCNMCHDLVEDGKLPQCVEQCVGMAKWFGDLDQGIETFEGPADATGTRRVLGDYVKEFSDEDVYTLTDSGNGPSMRYILRGKTWYPDQVMDALPTGGAVNGQ